MILLNQWPYKEHNFSGWPVPYFPGRRVGFIYGQGCGKWWRVGVMKRWVWSMIYRARENWDNGAEVWTTDNWLNQQSREK